MRLSLAAAFLFAAPSLALAQHTHGHAELSVAVDGEQLLVELQAPSGDIVGFEREPETDEERALVQTTIEALSQPGALIALDAAAGCEPSEVEAELEVEGDHAEFHVRHLYRCTAIDALGEAEVPLFAAYPGIVEIDAVTVSGAGSDAAELEPGDSLTVPSED